MKHESNIYFTTFTRKTHTLDSQKEYYDKPEIVSILNENNLSSLLDYHLRRNTYNTLISFKSEDIYSTSEVGPIFFKDEDSIKKLHNIFQLPDNKNSGFLMPGLISFSKNIVVFEMPPTYKLVSHIPLAKEQISEEIASTHTVESYIPIPWQIYVAIFNNDYMLVDTYMFYSRNSIITSGVEENIYSPALPNFYSNGLLCRPFYASTDDINKYPKDISGVIAAAYDSVWNSGWNADLVDTIIDTGFTASHSSETSIHSRKFFIEKDAQEKYTKYLSLLSNISYGARDKAWAIYVRAISDFDLEEVINSLFSPPAISQIWDRDFDLQRDELAEQFEHHADEDYSEEDVENYISDNFVNPRQKNKSFKDVLHGIIAHSSASNLYALSNHLNVGYNAAISTVLRNMTVV